MELRVIIGVEESKSSPEIALERGKWYVEMSAYPHKNFGYYVTYIMNNSQKMTAIGHKIEIFHGKYKCEPGCPIVQILASDAKMYVNYFLQKYARNFGVLIDSLPPIAIGDHELFLTSILKKSESER